MTTNPLKRKPVKYGSQFTDNQIKAIATRLFGELRDEWGREVLVGMLEEADEERKQVTKGMSV